MTMGFRDIIDETLQKRKRKLCHSPTVEYWKLDMIDETAWKRKRRSQ
jgi:hypothetical protein